MTNFSFLAAINFWMSIPEAQWTAPLNPEDRPDAVPVGRLDSARDMLTGIAEALDRHPCSRLQPELRGQALDEMIRRREPSHRHARASCKSVPKVDPSRGRRNVLVLRHNLEIWRGHDRRRS